MTQKEALELAIKVLNDIPNAMSRHGKTYDIIPKLEKALHESEVNLNTPFGPKWTLGDIIVVAENMEENINLEEAYEISKNIDNTLEHFDDDIPGITSYTIEMAIGAFLKKRKND